MSSRIDADERPDRRGVINDDERAPLLGTSSQDTEITVSGCIPTRYVLVILAYIGFFNVYMMRINLSVAMVAMADPEEKPTNWTPVHGSQCPGKLNSTDDVKGPGRTFNWDEETQNEILSAFFYGYILTQVPGGWLASRFGGKWIFGLGVLCTSILTLLTPLAASAGVGWFMALRVLEGVGEGVTYPAMYAIMAQWAPPFERSKMMIISQSGAIFGTIIANPIAGVMCDSEVLHGWPSVFYLAGSLGAFWFIFWALLIHDTPAKHPRISPEEREYIDKSIGPRQMTSLYVPIGKILTSVPVWGIFIPSFCMAWGGYTLLIDLPNYMKNVLHFDVTQSGFLSALPFVLMWMFYIIGSYLADSVRKKGYLSTVHTRKLFNSVGALISAICFVLVGLVRCNQYLAVTFLCTASIGSGLVQSGYAVNHLDIAPKYAGVIFGISNMFGTSTGFLAPTVVGLLTEGNNTIEQWQIVFWLSSGLYMLGFITFLFMGAGEEQDWAKNPDSDTSEHPNVNVDYYVSDIDEQTLNKDMSASFGDL